MIADITVKSNDILDNQETEASALLSRLQSRPDLFEHGLRVSKFSVEIAKGMGLSNQTQEDVRITGLFHDIGKLNIPQVIFLKKQLTSEEWELIKAHSQQGVKLMNGSNYLKKFTQWVLCHHERLDGSGYPEGLVEGQIPLISRIVAVADSFDAMITHRPYRNESFSIIKAISNLRDFAGTHFDPQVVETLERISQKNLISLLVCLF